MVRSLTGSLNEYQDPNMQAQIQRLLAQKAPSNKVQGLAYLLDQGLAGFMMGKDKTKRQAAQDAVSKAFAGGKYRAPEQVDAVKAEELYNIDRMGAMSEADMPAGSEPPMSDDEARKLRERENPNEIIVPGRTDPGYDPYQTAMSNLSALKDNRYASGLAADMGMKDALGARRLAQTLAADNRKASRKLADLKNMHLFKQGNPLTASSRPASPIQNDIYRQKLVSEFGANSDRVRQFDSFVRANTTLNLGDRQVIASGTGGTPIRSFTVKPKPGEMPFFKAAQERAIKLAAYEIEKTKDLPSAIGAFDGKRDQEALLIQINRQVQDIVKRGTTGGTGGVIKGLLPESDQFELNEQIKTFEAAIGLDALIAAKAKGATFGALTKNEMDLLIATAGSLNTLRDPKKVGQAIQRALNMFSQAQRRSEQSFYKKYGTGAHTPIPFVRNDADFNNLKKGQQFYDPNGQLRRKP